MKDFDRWNHIKQSLDGKTHTPFFNEREIWWCSVGVNVGYELLGKNKAFERPILILRKYNKNTFLGLPLTSKRKHIPAHYHVEVNDKEGSIILDQAKTCDSKRLIRRIKKLPETQFEEIKKAFIAYL